MGKTFRKKRILLIDSRFIVLVIDDNLFINFAIVVKLNKFIFAFFFFFFLLHKSMSSLFIKKDVRQLLDTIKNIKTIKLTKQ